MKLSNLKPNLGAKHRKKRLGSGDSSGRGKTSGRGGKGQSARSGSSIRIGFEGGQMPLIRRLPKRGFNNKRFRVDYLPINLDSLEEFPDGSVVNRELLVASGLIRANTKRIKILARGKLSKKLTVVADAFSDAAKGAIESVGGSASTVAA